MELFDVIKVLFELPNQWDTVSASDKKRHYFMINRYMSINFPLQASALQTKNTNPEFVVDFWQTFLRRQYTRTPGWLFTKGAKKAKEKKEKSLSISDKTIKEYAAKTQQDLNAIYDAMMFFQEDMVNEIKQYEKSLNIK